MNDTKCKLCRRAGKKLFLKGEKCFTPKCPFEKKPYAPGMPDSARKHRKTFSEYGYQLREKQKIKNIYGVSEKQFARYVKEATSRHGVSPAEMLYEYLERRLDNVVFRIGFASSRAMARQMVTHGHIMVNGRRVDIPSLRVKKGDVLEIREGSKGKSVFSNVAENITKRESLPWIKIDQKALRATIEGMPKLEKEETVFNITSVLEFYSR